MCGSLLCCAAAPLHCCNLLLCPAVDRSVTASLGDARDALTNAAIDSLTSYRQSVLTIQQPGMLAPACLRLFPLFILALLKQVSSSLQASSQSPRPLSLSSVNWMFLCPYRKPFGLAPAPDWMIESSLCRSWSTSLWFTPCWWSTPPCTEWTISRMRWDAIKAVTKKRKRRKIFLFKYITKKTRANHLSKCAVSFCAHSQGALNINDRTIPQPRLLQLSVEKLTREGAFLMDAGMVHFTEYGTLYLICASLEQSQSFKMSVYLV